MYVCMSAQFKDWMQIILHRICTDYGWLDDFPIEVAKGEVLTLMAGYRKGRANIRRIMVLTFDSDGEFIHNINYDTLHKILL